MTILFAISVAAFVALMWVSIATAQHIRRARRRRELAEAAEATTATASTPANWGMRETPRDSKPDWTSVAPHLAQAAEVRSAETTPPAADPAPGPPLAAAPPPPIRFPLSSQRRPSSTQIPVATAPAATPPVNAMARPKLSADQLSSSAAQFQLRRPPNAVPFNARLDRAFSNADAGDLSDPEPQRFRDRSRQR